MGKKASRKSGGRKKKSRDLSARSARAANVKGGSFSWQTLSGPATLPAVNTSVAPTSISPTLR